MLTVKSKLSEVPKIGPKYAVVLKKLNIETVRDFLLHLPFRYEDYSERIPIENLMAGSAATVMGEVIQSKLIRTWKKKMLITECHIKDDTGIIRAVWFNQPYISDSLVEGKGVRLSGKISEDKKGLYFSNPSWELSSRTPTNTGRLVPIYPETEGLTSRWIRWQMQSLIKHAEKLEDPIPENILHGLHLPTLKDAIGYAHFPKTQKQAELAQKRFAFEQMFLIQIVSQSAKVAWEKNRAQEIIFDEKLIKNFVNSLPFLLTNAQRKAAFQILKDLEKSQPMNRLLNGDVGSGKTVVAAMASLNVISTGFQVALMAPTEVLARQHFESVCKLFKKYKIDIALLTNSYRLICHPERSEGSRDSSATPQNDSRDSLLKKIQSGEIKLVIGTHALIQKDVHFKNLTLVIVDEQHRFGVDQRAFLQRQATEIDDGVKEKIPHLLSMTATPIPRTLALAFFGNLNLSVLDEMPKNRKKIITKIVSARVRENTYDFVRSEIKKGGQAFIIFPLVEESSKLTELKAATEEHKRLSENIFPDLRLALLHGRLKSNEKEKVMLDFKEKKYDILVSTSVVEVGIDVPNATIMIIEDADRFGLSQLHQFRGRVGRSDFQSYCFLFTSSSTVKAENRLKAMEKFSSGFDIADEDLKLRGPGEFLGTRQSGIPDTAMRHISNVKLIEISSDYAGELLSSDPQLKKHPLLKAALEKINKNIHLE